MKTKEIIFLVSLSSYLPITTCIIICGYLAYNNINNWQYFMMLSIILIFYLKPPGITINNNNYNEFINQNEVKNEN